MRDNIKCLSACEPLEKEQNRISTGFCPHALQRFLFSRCKKMLITTVYNKLGPLARLTAQKNASSNRK